MFSMPHITMNDLILFAIAFITGVFGIIMHEVAHGYVASYYGDPTAKILGRLTLNPIKHIDPNGLFMFLFTAILSTTAGGIILGWAKPVPVNPRFFSNPRKDMMAVSFAGPLTNFLLAIIFAVICRIIIEMTPTYGHDVQTVKLLLQGLSYGISINVTLAIFNLLPLPPLDGSHIVEGLLPIGIARKYASIGRYGFIILFLLLLSGFLGKILSPMVRICFDIIFSFVGL